MRIQEEPAVKKSQFDVPSPSVCGGVPDGTKSKQALYALEMSGNVVSSSFSWFAIGSELEQVSEKLEAFGVSVAKEKLEQIQRNTAMIKALTKRIKNVKEQTKDLPVSKLDDGTLLIWLKTKILAGNHTSKALFSDPFYLEIRRYKLRLEVRMVSNGDQDEYLSILVHVMKGDFDSVLKWPFRHSITVTLKSQKDESDIVRTYHPNQEEKQMKPKPDQDITFGGEFATYDQLQQMTTDFTSDSTTCLECKVNFC